MQYKSKFSTLLKKKPIQGSLLSETEKVVVNAGEAFNILEVLEDDGLHRRVELDFNAGVWWLFLPHWDVGSFSGNIKAVFSMDQQQTNNLIVGSLTFSDSSGEILKVKATSGLAGYQYKGAHTQVAKGCIPPGTGWKINTSGYYLSTKGVEGMFYHITPDPHTSGRSEFGVHRDANVPGSSGCIVILSTSDFTNKVSPLLDGLKDTQKQIPLSVIYG